MTPLEREFTIRKIVKLFEVQLRHQAEDHDAQHGRGLHDSNLKLMLKRHLRDVELIKTKIELRKIEIDMKTLEPKVLEPKPEKEPDDLSDPTTD